ncbi:MAG: DMT family transporter [Acidobacteria bacterium]|nr:DMT family transporter [Acidobacteriota bacterium]
MAYILALGSAALYGAADFLGGLASRQASAITIVLMSQAVGLVLLTFTLPFLPSAQPLQADVIWGGLAGLAGGIGVALLYRALAVGRMAVVAPVTAVCAVTIPVTVGLWFGEQLAWTTAIGVGLALVAIVLVSQQGVAAPTARRGGTVPRGVGLALVSGVAIGVFFLALAETDARAGMWPLVSARAASVIFFGAMVLVGKRPLRVAAPVIRIAVAAGVIDVCANALYLLATRYGPLNVAVTLSSLYPASTVVLARLTLGERLNAWQAAGLGCALVAIALIVGGSGAF